MQIRQRKVGDVIIYTPQGEIKIDTVESLKNIFSSVIKNKYKKAILSFAAVDYIDSLGIAALIGFVKDLERIDGQLALADIPPKIASIFSIIKVDKIFKICDNEKDALKLLNGVK